MTQTFSLWHLSYNPSHLLCGFGKLLFSLKFCLLGYIMGLILFTGLQWILTDPYVKRLTYKCDSLMTWTLLPSLLSLHPYLPTSFPHLMHTTSCPLHYGLWMRETQRVPTSSSQSHQECTSGWTMLGLPTCRNEASACHGELCSVSRECWKWIIIRFGLMVDDLGEGSGNRALLWVGCHQEVGTILWDLNESYLEEGRNRSRQKL